MIIYFISIIGLLAIDQLVKIWAVSSLAPVGTIELIPGVFQLTYAENFGSAFSLFQGMRWIVVAMTIVLAVALLYMMIKKKHIIGVFANVGAAFAIAGAVGNAIDRVVRGFVVDLFDFNLINFAIFNVADVFITIGAGMLIIYFLFIEGKKKGEKIDTDKINGAE